MSEENATRKEVPLNVINTADSINLDRTIVQAIINSNNKILIADTYMKLRDINNQIGDNKVLLQQKLNFMFSGTDDQLNILSIRASELTDDAIKKASLEELKDIFVFDGKFIGLSIIENLKEEDQTSAYRDFLLYLKEKIGRAHV